MSRITKQQAVQQAVWAGGWIILIALFPWFIVFGLAIWAVGALGHWMYVWMVVRMRELRRGHSS